MQLRIVLCARRRASAFAQMFYTFFPHIFQVFSRFWNILCACVHYSTFAHLFNVLSSPDSLLLLFSGNGYKFLHCYYHRLTFFLLESNFKSLNALARLWKLFLHVFRVCSTCFLHIHVLLSVTLPYPFYRDTFRTAFHRICTFLEYLSAHAHVYCTFSTCFLHVHTCCSLLPVDFRF